MGIEYRIEFQYKDRVKLAEMLCTVPFFTKYDGNFEFYEYRADAKAKADVMPDAYLEIEPGGIYFCNNCGALSENFLSHLVNLLTTAYGQLKIEEL